MSTRRAPRRPDPGWIEFPPLWPESVARERRGTRAEEERPAVVLTSRIPRIGRRERPRVLRIVTGARAR